MPITPNISKKMLALKEETGKTYEQIGKEVGTSDANARRYITGETKTPDLALLRAIIVCIGGDPDEILGNKTLPALPPPSTESALYDRMLSDMRERHREEMDRLAAAHAQALQGKDAWIDRLKSENDNVKSDLTRAKDAQARLSLVIAALAAAVILLVLAFVLPDALDGSWGRFRY
jgi:predicted transcriptional regulator